MKPLALAADHVCLQFTVLMAMDVAQHYLDKLMTRSASFEMHVKVSILGETLHDSLVSIAATASACNGNASDHKRCRQEQRVVSSIGNV